LRSTADYEDHPALEIGPEAATLLGANADERLRRALREWRDAADSDNSFDRVTHLWRSIEIYAKGATATPLFTDEEIRDVQEAVAGIEGLSYAQQVRLRDLGSRANDAPLLARLRAALERDDIDITDDEFALLRTTRDLRNALEHRRTLTSVEDRAVARALGIVDRVLVTALVGSRE
jgi:hypothetical protein